MSVLETPRILFRGQISWDPIVTNNYPPFYDENDGQSTLPSAATIQQQVAAFREEAVVAVSPSANPPRGPRGNWNPHGTHRSTFFDTEVTGVDTGGGVDTSDPFVGSPIDFTAMLVDCEPFGAVSSQLFFDTMAFGNPGGCLVSCARSTRMIARYINFSRNSYNAMVAGVASVVWQTSFPKSDGLLVDAHGSPALQALGEALTADDVAGLTVRWNSYRTVYYDDPTLRNGSARYAAAAQRQIERLDAGGFQPNPARSLVVGVLGLWRAGEPAQEPGDRPLLTVPPGELIASAHARIDGQTLTIDLSNSIPEIDDILTKQDLGTLDVVAVGDDRVTPIATLGSLKYHQYDRNAYELGAGIVSLQLDPADVETAAANDIQVRGSDGSPYLAETMFWAVPLEHNRYLDESDPATATAVQAYVRGAPAPEGLPVTRYEASGAAPVFHDQAFTDANGIAVFPIAPIPGGGLQPYLFVAGPDPVTPVQLDTQLTPYMYVRTLPADAAVGTLAPTWDNVYSAVLANWNAMAPCMDNWLRLDDPAQVHAYGAVIKQLTDPGGFEAFRFMPVTRDMTVGERTLLWNFLDAPFETDEPAASLAEAAPPEAVSPAPARRDLAKLSRAMRSR
jgi:hypothetical protein